MGISDIFSSATNACRNSYRAVRVDGPQKLIEYVSDYERLEHFKRTLTTLGMRAVDVAAMTKFNNPILTVCLPFIQGALYDQLFSKVGKTENAEEELVDDTKEILDKYERIFEDFRVNLNDFREDLKVTRDAIEEMHKEMKNLNERTKKIEKFVFYGFAIGLTVGIICVFY